MRFGNMVLTILVSIEFFASPALAVGQDSKAPPDLSTYAVTRPGVTLVVPEARMRELTAMDGAASRFCASPKKVKFEVLDPVVSLKGKESQGSDKASQPFALQMMADAAAAYGADDPEAARTALANLRSWAQADALRDIVEVGGNATNTNSVYSLKRTLVPTLVAWSLLRTRPDISPSDSKMIEAWLGRLVTRADVDTGGVESRGDDSSISNKNNHRYLRDSVNMLWGTLAGDQARYRRGVERYFIALGQMRDDGSLPLEVRRGAHALWYQRHALASLVLMAELAAVQGQDLYGVSVNGHSIHQGIKFLLDAIDSQSLVRGYAAENFHPGTDMDPSAQDLGFLQRRGNRNYMAWVEPYIRRFPNSENAKRLVALQDGQLLAQRPLIDDYSGGNLTCLFAKP
jgi:poly(beta-D-mannuronate) lyase